MNIYRICIFIFPGFIVNAVLHEQKKRTVLTVRLKYQI